MAWYLFGDYLRVVIFFEEEYNSYYKVTDLNFFMILLVVVLFLIMLMVQITFKIRLNFLLVVLIWVMIVNEIVVFFLFYEIVFILIIFVIVLLGYRYERLIAAFIIIFYSFMFSSPTLLMVIMLDHTFLIKEWLYYFLFLNYFLVGSFMVKFPIFGFHYWLPVAHVEASTIGSILLAGVLLKLGTVGLFYIVSYIGFIVKFHWLVIGVLITMLIILALRDLKMMIAYSSVAHISIVFYIISFGTLVGKKGAIFIIFYHGFISPLIFWVVGLLAWWKTRSLLVIKMISFSYLFLLCLFVLCIMNMGFPPFIGFISEVLIFKSLIMYKIVLYMIRGAILFSCYYNVYLFWCFTNFIGLVFKLNFFSLDVFLFLLFIFLLNF